MRAFRSILAGRGAAGATLIQCIALAPPVALALSERGPEGLRLALAALAVALLWDGIFAIGRRRTVLPHGITTAAIFAALAPADISLWQVAVALSIGAVIGELVFGGRGFAFLSPAAVALAVAVLGAPGAPLLSTGPAVALAALPGAALLLAAGLLPWRVLAGFALALPLASGALSPAEAWALATPAAFAAIFVLCDPVACAATGAGRIAQGALAGWLTVVLGAPGAALPEALVFAALLSSIVAPLLDEGVIALMAWRRERRDA